MCPDGVSTQAICAGQGLVAFARGVHDQLDYAIKFFINRESFMAEQKLYESNTLGALLPQVGCPNGSSVVLSKGALVSLLYL